MLTIYDSHNRTQSLAWLASNFGNVEIKTPLSRAAGQPDEAGSPYYEIVELRENAVPDAGADRTPAVEVAATATVTVRDVTGAPVEAIPIAVYWPGAPAEDGIGWEEHGVTGHTGTDGRLSLTIGGGAHYDPQVDQGPLRVWITGPGRSQMVAGLGRIAGGSGTSYRHLDVTFQQVKPPDSEPWEGAQDRPCAVAHRLGQSCGMAQGSGPRDTGTATPQDKPSSVAQDRPGDRPLGPPLDWPPDAEPQPDLNTLLGLLAEAQSYVEKKLPIIKDALDRLGACRRRGED